MEEQRNCAVCNVPLNAPMAEHEKDRLFQKLADLMSSSGESFEEFESGSADVLEELTCEKCVTSVGSALEWRERVNGVEERVRILQLKIEEMRREVVRLLGVLEENVKCFKIEVGRVEGLVGGNTSAFKIPKKEMEEMENDSITRFRRIIFRVAQELHTSAEQFGGSPPVKVEKDDDFAEEEEDFVPADENVWNHLQMELAEDPLSLEKAEVKTEDEVDEPGMIVEEEVSADDPDFEPEEMGTFDGWSESSASEEYEDDASDVERSPKTSLKSKRSSSKVVKIPVKKTCVRKQNKSTKSRSPTGFKNDLISRMLHNPDPNISAEQQTEDEISPLTLRSVSYDSATDILTLNGVPLIIDEKQRKIMCSLCDRQMSLKTQAKIKEIEVYDHVLGFHLNLYQCPKCPAKNRSYHNFRQHLTFHKTHPDTTCDICGKPMLGWRALQKHKWLHKSQEEKEEAIKNGEKPSPQKDKLKPKREDLQCSTCGKIGFVYPSDLKVHERTHLPKADVKPQFTCPRCGNQFKYEGSLQTHLKFNVTCRPANKMREHEKLFRIQCDQCPKKFKFECALRQHKAQKHSDLRTIPCDVCEKMFKTKKEVRAHKSATHATGRKYHCKIGCGVTFRAREYARRHEKKCKGKEEKDAQEALKKYKCRFCDKRYIRSQGRTVHQREKHADLLSNQNSGQCTVNSEPASNK